jgi:hypothetical protein
MKNVFASLIVMVILAAGAIASAATTAGMPATSGGQKVLATVAEKSKSACTSITAGRATAITVDVSSTPFMNWFADDGTGTGVKVKRYLGSNTAYMTGTGESNLPINATTKTVKFARYSGSAAINLCSERM